MKKPKILMVYIEPTSYIIGLVDAIINLGKEQIDILFLTENKSQDWNIELNPHCMLLPTTKRFSFCLNLLLKNKYQMIHLAGWSEKFCLLFLLLGKMLNIKVAMESDTCFSGKMSWWKKTIKNLIYPSLFKLVNVFFPGGKRQANYLEHYAVNPQRIVTANMTVDVSNIQQYANKLTLQDRENFRQRFNIPSDHLVFIFVGRLESYKGISELIIAFNQLKNSNVSLLIVGDGCMREIVEKHISDQVHYAGRLSHTELLQAYYAADVLVLPSHFEPWGLVVNEAMAIGLPVIVSDRIS